MSIDPHLGSGTKELERNERNVSVTVLPRGDVSADENFDSNQSRPASKGFDVNLTAFVAVAHSYSIE
jgi:hypothetical protein